MRRHVELADELVTDDFHPASGPCCFRMSGCSGEHLKQRQAV